MLAITPAGQAFAGQAYASPRPPDGNLDFPCNFLGACPPRVQPGGPDRDARPFTGSLGRPCAWRDRPTPEGPRRVRVCW
ncbi:MULTISPECIES: hypothetical protein [Methylobacterium]|uniref:hypothetical protein n=1 Tax=Methylobacterium TaxID=407 RepID=UPI0011C1F3CB|nr:MULTISPECIES: hypothetical protein [Methylobacterium]QEE43046.1 hypothetical protein FVA80_28630 [Methylobacterium sp. WL1]TXN43763.1 hypothetical protein FV233_17310 [Methylobacterium sp. WL7]TXN54218.1 hypothetical protein FV241_25055 [Methylobacterium sp. WL2]TXN73930.1 hypothetical protein FV228_07030 [Methylobacterium sp. WL18]TXN03608.1 hypothetical protein FV242_10555 [Methylobacterium sp. WL64]